MRGDMMKKKMKIVGITAAILAAVSMTPTTVLADDLLQDAGSWLQVVGEGSLKSVEPGLEKGRIWLERQSRWDNTGIIGIKAWFAQQWVIRSVIAQRFGLAIPGCLQKMSVNPINPSKMCGPHFVMFCQPVSGL
jgi:hypothetical protein